MRAMGKWWIIGLGVLVGILAALSIAYAQFAVPTSDTIISGVLTLPDKSLARFQVREGSMLIVREGDDEEGLWYGLIPHVENTKKARFSGYKLIPHSDAAPDVRPALRKLEVTIGEQTDLPLDGLPLSVKLEGFGNGVFPTIPAIRDPSKIDPQTLQAFYGASGNGFCSVTCGSTTVTSTSVQMECGACEGAR